MYPIQWLVAALSCFGALVPPVWAFDPPSNDDCSDAISVDLGETAFSNIDATVESPGVPCASAFGRDVWFRFTSTFTGTLRIQTCDDADFDSVIAVYQSCSCGSFNLIGCNDDSTSCPDETSRVTVSVEVDTCYKIRVGGFQGDSGLGVLTLRVVGDENAAGADRIRTGFEPEDRFGFSVSGGGRINSDSFDDVLVGAYLNDMLGLNTGRAYAYQGPNETTLHTLTGEAASDQFGFSVATDCDCNDDGRADMIIGAPLHDTGGINAGRVYVFSGFDGSLLWSRDGFAADDRFGSSVACAGDINSDSFDDVIVGAPRNDVGGIDAGQAYVLDGEDGSILRTRTGQGAGEWFGHAVAGIGDLNDDGDDDFAVGAPKNDANGTDAGRVSLFSGDDNSVLRRLNGDEPGDRFGSSVAGIRDATSFAFDVIAIGAPNNDASGSNTGQVKVYWRNISNPGSMDCNKLVCLLYSIHGGNPGDRIGTSVDVGDVTGNGFADIIAGAPQADLNGSNSGAAYIFDGQTGALTHTFHGEAPNDRFGQSVAIAGDVNDDNDDDLIVGAPYNDAGGTSAGRAYTFFLDDSANLIALPPPDGSSNEVADPASTADLDQNGVVNADDLILLLNQWGECAQASSCTADLNGDGAVNADDLSIVTTNWN